MTTNCLDRKLINNTANLLPFLKIISDGNRLKILCLLKGGERCVCDLYENLDLAQNLVSSHLKILKDFGLIEVRQEGKKNYQLGSRSRDQQPISAVRRHGLSQGKGDRS